MWRNYLRVTIRSLLKHRTNFTINLAGLSLGFVCFLFILLFVLDELSYDRFHEDYERIYRIKVDRYSEGGAPEFTATTSGPMLPAAVNDVVQIESSTRLYLNASSVKFGDVAYFEENFMYADAEFFQVFTFPAIAGDLDSALVQPDSLVLTRSTAARYFVGQDPLGQFLEVNDRLMEVRAVIEDVPDQSHFTFDFLASFATQESMFGPSSEWGWWALQYHAYIKLLPGSDVDLVQDLVYELPARYIGDQEEGSGYRQFLLLQPLDSIHLNSNFRFELGNNSTRQTVFLFAAVALFVLLIACINFINLSTARSMERAREVALRKVVGARKSQLIVQFLGESLVMSMLALLIALAALQVLMPAFNALAEKSISFHFLNEWPLLTLMVLGTLLIGVIAGLYPAFVLASFKPALTLKGEATPGSRRAWLRQSLVVLQFSISIALIVGSLVAQRQLNYMLDADMGFAKEQVLVVNARNSSFLDTQLEAFRQQVLSIPGVNGMTASASIPGRAMPTNVASLERDMTDSGQTFYFLPVDHDFIDVFELDIIAGRGFSRDYETDASAAFIVNESAYRALGFGGTAEVLGVELVRQFGDPRDVIGVMSDFNYRSLQYTIEPLVLYLSDENFAFVSVKLNSADINNTIAAIERVWYDFEENVPFEYFFLEQDFNNQYHLEQQISRLLQSFTVLAIFIACMGLYALAAFMTEKRRKEVGIRKVLGASVNQIAVMLSYSFSKPVIVATIITIPLCWYAADRWLSTFATRIDMSLDIIVLAVMLAFAIALTTVIGQAIRAAMNNPTRTLRAE